MTTEPDARIIIDKLLRESGWIMPGESEQANVLTEIKNNAGEADYVLLDSKGYYLCAVEAKRSSKSPLIGKKQARDYAKSLKCRFVLLSNSVKHYLWDLECGSPFIIETLPTQFQLESKKTPTPIQHEEIKKDYVAITQEPDYKNHPEYIDLGTREDFLISKKLKFLRDYQLAAVLAVQKSAEKGNDRFLLEMATGTGKTLTSTAIIKMFLRLFGVKRVLFLVDRLELEDQAKREFNEILSNDYEAVIWKENTSDWRRAEIVVSTVQSFISKNKYKQIFNHNDFDLVISDEAHRSLGERSRRVFEYFNGYKLGLTATPKNYLKSVDIDMLGKKDPRQLENRFLLDTYNIFGCESGEPTYRYSLENGVKEGYLINPKVIDARTEITTQLLSDQGYIVETVDSDGNDIQESMTRKDFEKKFFSIKTNYSFCKTFFEKAKKDPFTNEIGKSLIFCISQNHATKITHLLNQMADKLYPGEYQSDFAEQVTSEIRDSKGMTIDFSDTNNSLNGYSTKNPYYRTSKTRVCVTVGMMTTGYDCKDLLNICLMRPVYSPSDFIQMKGRGTRKHDFKSQWISKNKIPKGISSEKKDFLLLDFMGNYEYFEKEFDYDEILKLPSISNETGDGPIIDIDEIEIDIPDPIQLIDEINLGHEGMRIDRDLYPTFKKEIRTNRTLSKLMEDLNLDEAGEYLSSNILGVRNEKYSIDKLAESLGLDRKLTIPELLLYAFDQTDNLKSRKECIEEEFEKLYDFFKLSDKEYTNTKKFFSSYVTDSKYRNIIDSKDFGRLNVHPSGEAFKNTPEKIRKQIPKYVRENVNLERLKVA